MPKSETKKKLKRKKELGQRKRVEGKTSVQNPYQKKLHQSAPQKEALLKSLKKLHTRTPKIPQILPYALTEGLLPQIDKVAAYIFIFKNLFGKI